MEHRLPKHGTSVFAAAYILEDTLHVIELFTLAIASTLLCINVT